MARGTTLGELVNKLRIAAKLDPNPALSLNLVPWMKQLISDEQERLYDEFDWPHLKITADKQIAAGQRYYDVPTDMNLERIIAVDIKWSGVWLPVERGISLDHYNAYDSDDGDRADPVQRWDVKDTGDGEQIEIWPIPNTDYDADTGDGALRFTGIRKLEPLIDNDDIADLDDIMIVLYAAGEMLGGAKDATAQLTLSKAKARMETLQGRSTKTRRNQFSLGGHDPSMERQRDRTPQVAYVRNP